MSKYYKQTKVLMVNLFYLFFVQSVDPVWCCPCQTISGAQMRSLIQELYPMGTVLGIKKEYRKYRSAVIFKC